MFSFPAAQRKDFHVTNAAAPCAQNASHPHQHAFIYTQTKNARFYRLVFTKIWEHFRIMQLCHSDWLWKLQKIPKFGKICTS